MGVYVYTYIVGLKSQARFYALNILEELDDSNEVYIYALCHNTTVCHSDIYNHDVISSTQYYVDRGSGIMYLLKPSAEEVVRNYTSLYEHSTNCKDFKDYA